MVLDFESGCAFGTDDRVVIVGFVTGARNDKIKNKIKEKGEST